MKTAKKREGRSFAKKMLRVLVLAVILLLVAIVVGAAGLYVYLSHTVDLQTDEIQFSLSKMTGVTRFYYDGTRDDEQYVPCEWEGEALLGKERRTWTPISEIPTALADAFVSIEDKRFYRHDGVDWLRTAKAALNYVFRFERKFGGSTITQQVVKNLTGDTKKTPMRKVREMYKALSMEERKSKRDILEMYLNIVPLGRNITGVGMAAKLYFGKDVSALTVGECASLAAITNLPARYDLYKHPEENKKRRDLILREMYREGYLTKEAQDAALSENVVPIPFESRAEHIHSWYIDHVVEDVLDDLMEMKGWTRAEASRLLYNGGLSIHTCADLAVQKELENYFCNVRLASPDVHYAMTVLSSKTGDLLGIVGREGVKEGNRLLNYATDVRRPPGSTIKPLSLYAPALEEGVINYATVLDDVPTSFQKREDGSYRPWPRNSPASYRGLCDMKTAIADSKNTVAVRVYEMLGKEVAYDYLVRRMHVGGLVRNETNEDGKSVSDLNAAPLALGQLSYGVNLLDMTAAYGIFTDGEYRRPRSYLFVYDTNGRVLLENKKESERVISKQNAYIMTKLLEGVTDFGTAKELLLPDVVATAGKTGTSSFDRDRWFVGYTPQYVAGIWCGAVQNGKNASDGKVNHLEAWDTVMRGIYQDEADAVREFREVSGVYKCPYCRDSGHLLSDSCHLDPRGSRVDVGYFTAEQMPKCACERHVEVLYDDLGEGVVVDDYFGGVPRKVSLIHVEERRFPMQIAVLDAEYVYRTLKDKPPNVPSNGRWQAYFSGALPNGVYVGISPTANGKQFNALSRFYGKEENRGNPNETENFDTHLGDDWQEDIRKDEALTDEFLKKKTKDEKSRKKHRFLFGFG